MATYERKKEFGYIRCVGATPLHVIKLVLIETFIICAVGIASGIIAGWLFSSGVEGWIRQFLPYVPAGKILRPNVTSLFITILVIFGLGILAGIYPSYRASEISPMEAIRNE
jgi:putative ABC transport system permease protein